MDNFAFNGIFIFILRNKCQCQADGCADEQDAEHIPLGERIYHVVGDDAEDVVIVGEFTQVLGYIGLSCRHHFCRQVLWTDEEIEHKTNRCCRDGGQERVGDGVEENA